MKKPSSDVVVIGAGAAGCAAAYFLAQEGVSVTIIERDSVASHASGTSGGLLLPLTAAMDREFLLPLAELSYRMHMEMGPQLEEESGVKLNASDTSVLKVCIEPGDSDEVEAFQRLQQGAEGFSSQWMDGDELRRVEPRLSEEVSNGAVMGPISTLDAFNFTLALAQSAERMGVELRHGTVTGLETAEGRLRGVQTEQRMLSCDACVVATGPWAGSAGDWLGIPVPLKPHKGQIVHLQGLEPGLPFAVSWRFMATQKEDGLLWIGSTIEDVGFDDSTTTDARDRILQGAVRVMPSLIDVPIVRQTACFRPMAPDNIPIVDGNRGVEGVYVCGGGGKHGILMSLAMGKAIADMIVRGATEVPIEPCGLARFDSYTPEMWGQLEVK